MTGTLPGLEVTRPRSLRWVLKVLGLYFGLALASLWLAGQRTDVANLWFANPVGTVALLALPLRFWLPMLGALGLTNVLVNMVAHALPSGAAQLLEPSAWGMAAAYAPGNCAEMLLAAVLLKRQNLGLLLHGHTGALSGALLLGTGVPALVSALAGASVLTASDSSLFPAVWGAWFVGSVVGSVAVLPLALAVWLRGVAPLQAALRQPRTIGLLVLSLGVTLLAATSLSKPFVVIVLPLMLLATRTDFSVTALATGLTAAVLGGLIETGVLVIPPTSTWWGHGLFYLSVLATLLPGLFLATSVEGRAAVLQQLSASENRFRTLYTKTPAMMFSMDPQGRIFNASGLWLSTLGYTEPEVLGRFAVEFLTPESARYAREEVMPQSLRDGRCDNVAYQIVTRDGQILDVLLAAVWELDDQGQALQGLAVMEDVTEKKRLAERSHFAEHDPLTGLPNRVLLQDRLERSCLHHARQGGSFALGFLDLDHFKAINDTLGHDAGDAVLREVARRLAVGLRASDTVCRVGGDEFVLLFASVEDIHELQALAAKLLAQVAWPLVLDNTPGSPRVDIAGSMGIAVFPEHGRDPQTLMRHADQAMYSAKRGGRSRCEFYKPAD